MSIKEQITLLPQGYYHFLQELHETNGAPVSGLHPTPYFVREGQILQIDVHNSDNLRITIGVPNTPQQTQNEALGNGTNFITVKTDGPLFFNNQSLESTTKISLTLPDNIERTPYFKLGQTTNEEFLAQLKAHPEIPNVIWEGEKSIFAFNRDYTNDDLFQSPGAVKDNIGIKPLDTILTNPQATVSRMDAWIKAENELANYTNTSSTDVGDSLYNGKTIHLQVNGGYIGTGVGYVGYNDFYAISMLADPSQNSEQGWGQLHEMGHNRQQGLWELNGETAPNIYGWNARFEVDKMGFNLRFAPDGKAGTLDNASKFWNKMYELGAKPNENLESPSITNADRRHAFEVMMDQLYSAFGPGLYANMQHIYSIMSNKELIAKGFYNPDLTEGAKFGQVSVDQFYVNVSKITGHDLTKFFVDWKCSISQAAHDEVAALKLKPMTIDLASFELGKVASPADLLNYDLVDFPSGLPSATANHNMIFQDGTVPPIEKLINYDPKVVAKVEYLNGGVVKLNNAFDLRTEVEMLITGVNGEKNVVLANVLATPKEWGDQITSQDIYQKVLDFYQSDAFKSALPGEVQMRINWLNSIGVENSSWLIKALSSEWTENSPKVQSVFDFMDNLGPEDMVNVDGKIGFYVPKPIFNAGFRISQFHIDGHWCNPAMTDEIANDRYFINYDPKGDPYWNASNPFRSDGELRVSYTIWGDMVPSADTAGSSTKFKMNVNQIRDVNSEPFLTTERSLSSVNQDDVSILNLNEAVLRIHKDVYESLEKYGYLDLDVLVSGRYVGGITGGVPGQNLSITHDDRYYYFKITGLNLTQNDTLLFGGDYFAGAGIGRGSFDISVGVDSMVLDGSTIADAFAATPRSELIYGYEGDDTIAGLNGNDLIYSGAGNDVVFAGAGDDTVFGGAGNDLIYGGDGNDSLYGNQGDDTIIGGAGADFIEGGDGIDIASYFDRPLTNDAGLMVNLTWGVNSDNDHLVNIEGIRGSNLTNDQLLGTNGDNIFYGEGGADTLIAYAGNDSIYGGVGNDTALIGGAGRDILYGGDGDDSILGDGEVINPVEGNGLFYGGYLANGWETINIGGTADISTDNTGFLAINTKGLAGSDGGCARLGNKLDEYYKSSESYKVQLGYFTNDSTPSRAVVRLYAVDKFGTATRIDTVILPKATLSPEPGFAIFRSNPALAQLDGQQLMVTIEAWSDFTEAPGSNQTMYFRNIEVTSSDPLFGMGNQQFSRLGESDTIYGDAGKDVLLGGAANDLLYGGTGNDTIYGGVGDDTLQGDSGASLLDGGDGMDVVSYFDRPLTNGEGLKVNLTTGVTNNSDTLVSIEGLHGSNLTNDLLVGSNANNALYGEGGDDSLAGYAGNDTIYGGAGNDNFVAGGKGNDIIYGGDGNDALMGDSEYVNPVENNGTFYGGYQNNGWTLIEGPATVTTTADGALAIDTKGLAGSNGGYARLGNKLGQYYKSSESYTVDVDYWTNDNFPSRSVVRIYTVDSNGVPTARIGTQILPPATANAQHGSATFDANPAFAKFNGQQLMVTVEAWSDWTEGTPGSETTYFKNVAVKSSDIAFGVDKLDDSKTGGDDTIYGGAGSDFLSGGGGNDLIYGGSSINPTLGDYDDFIWGGYGDDTIVFGSAGEVWGNSGSDKFIYDGTRTRVSGEIRIRGGDYTADGSSNYDVLDILSLGKDYTILGVDKNPDGSYSSGVVNFTTTDGAKRQIMFSEIEKILHHCFTRGTMIQTPQGLVAVETLKTGDLVMTKDHGAKPIHWISSQLVTKEAIVYGNFDYPVRIAASALGAGYPDRDLIVSPHHRMLVNSRFATRAFGQSEVLLEAKELISLDGVEFVVDFDAVEYFHFMFDKHEIVYANGAETESFYTGPEALKSIPDATINELLSIFPELAEYQAGCVPNPARPIISGARARKLVEHHHAKKRALFDT